MAAFPSPQHRARTLLEAAGRLASAATPADVEQAVRHEVEILLGAKAVEALAPDEQEYLSALLLLGEQAGERTRLLAAERDARLRTERLQRLTASLSRATRTGEVVDGILENGLRAADASAAFVSLVDEAGTALELVGARGHDEALLEPWRRTPLASSAPHSDAARGGRAQFIDGRDELRRRYPAFSTALGRDATRWAVLPLAASGEPIGALVLSFESARPLADDDRAFLATVAAQCAQALERAALYERTHQVAEALQQSLLPSHLPQLPEAAIAALYRAGSPSLGVGGDWYDALTLDAGRLALSIGDVVGRGAQAAVTMGQLRSALRAYLLDGCGPAETLSRLNRFAGVMDGGFATASVAVLDLRSRELRIASAGHPPPLLVADTGTAELLDGLVSLPLGALADTPYQETALVLPPGATLFLYTDGLVEERDRPLDESLSRLVRTVESAPPELSRLVQHVAAQLAGGPDRRDDVALLAVRATGAFALRFAAEPERLAGAFAALRAWLEASGADQLRGHDLLVATAEACANAVEHSGSPTIEVEGRIADGELRVTVRDRGAWDPMPAAPDRGRGIRLMETLAGRVDIERTPEGTTVVLRAPLAATAPAELSP